MRKNSWNRVTTTTFHQVDILTAYACSFLEMLMYSKHNKDKPSKKWKTWNILKDARNCKAVILSPEDKEEFCCLHQQLQGFYLWRGRF